MPLASGATFAGYTVLRLLGSNAGGEVYLVQHPQLSHRNALEILSATLAEDREFRDRFMREAGIATTLYHRHIVEVHCRGKSEGHLWIAMDYVNGSNAEQLIAKRFPAGMPAGEALATVTAIADALDYAHHRGMLHRNVRPANILFADPEDGEQQILLTGFGIAPQLGARDGLLATNLTADMAAYAAPEQLTGSDVDGRADQYSLAAATFYLLTGAPPFGDSIPAAVINQHLTAAPPKLQDRRPEVARLDEVLSAALSKNPDDRFGSCRGFADALSQCAAAPTSDRSPEAYLSVVDYPDGEVPRSQVGMGAPTHSSVPSLWTKTTQRLTQRRKATASSTTQPVIVTGSPGVGSTRRRWPWILGAAVAAVLCVGMLAVGIMIGRKESAISTRALRPTTGIHAPAPSAGPSTSARNVPGPGEILDGSYRFDVNRAHQTYNDTLDPQPPNVSTWWVFRTFCTSPECVATGILLDDTDQQKASTKTGLKPLILDFHDGAWQSRPETVQFDCVGPNGTSAKQTTTQVIWLQQDHGVLRGVMTVTVQSNECGQQGAQIRIPTVVVRVGDMPAGVAVPTPPTTIPTTPGAPSTPGR